MSMEIGVGSMDMEEDEVVEEEPEQRRAPGDSLHRGLLEFGADSYTEVVLW
jgi:hypothetical protein